MANNKFHKGLYVVLTGSSEPFNYVFTLLLGSTKFPKNMRQF